MPQVDYQRGGSLVSGVQMKRHKEWFRNRRVGIDSIYAQETDDE